MDEDRDGVDAGGEPHDSDNIDAKGQTGYSRGYGGSMAAKQSESDFVADRYNMKHNKRGMAVIFNNKNFDKRLGMRDRDGTDVDCQKMYTMLSKMGFEEINVCQNATVQKMQSEMIKVSRQDHKDSDCFVCVVLTHGEEGVVYGTDGRIGIDELVQPIKGNNCESLGGKPKIFFIQACRGDQLDSGMEVSDASQMEEAMEEEVVMRRIPTEADFLMCYSVVPGYFAWRNTTRGSWFIQAVHDVFTLNWNKMDILSLLTRVNRKVAYDFESNSNSRHMNQKKQIPCITSMLTKDLFFC